MKIFLVMIALTFFTGCSSVTYKQREYVDATYLADTAVPNTSVEGEEGTRTVRSLNGENYTLTVYPITPAGIEDAVKKTAFKTNRPVEKVRAEYSNLHKTLVKRSCFSVSTSGRHKDAANLSYFFLTAETPKGLAKLENLRGESAPEENTQVASYTTGGYGYTIGKTYYYTPSNTHVYSYKTYSMSEWYCARNKLDLAKGFTIYVDARYKEGLPIHDLVWSTAVEDKSNYDDSPGMPYRLLSPQGREWVKDRYKSNWAKIRGTTSAKAE